jgi:DTW domain-containing protein YfiP
MQHGSCLCASIPRVETRTRVVLLLHRVEDRKTTNTGRLAVACLPNSEVILRGEEGKPTPPFVATPGTQPLVLFPHADAVPLERDVATGLPVTLLVPDGTWRQAAKVRNRVAGLASVPCVSLPRGEASAYRLRSGVHDGGLSTMEAIARALGVLEGPHVERALLDLFRTMVARSLRARGVLASADVR